MISNRTNKTQGVAQPRRTASESELTMTSVYERLKNLQITLLGVPPSVWMATLLLSFRLSGPAI